MVRVRVPVTPGMTEVERCRLVRDGLFRHFGSLAAYYAYIERADRRRLARKKARGLRRRGRAPAAVEHLRGR